MPFIGVAHAAQIMAQHFILIYFSIHSVKSYWKKYNSSILSRSQGDLQVLFQAKFSGLFKINFKHFSSLCQSWFTLLWGPDPLYTLRHERFHFILRNDSTLIRPCCDKTYLHNFQSGQTQITLLRFRGQIGYLNFAWSQFRYYSE